MKRCRWIMIGVLIIIAIGRVMPMTLFPEPEDPWYLPYTSVWWIVAGLIFYPSALFSEAIGLSFNDNTYLIVDAIWLLLLCALIYWLPVSSPGSEEDPSHQG